MLPSLEINTEAVACLIWLIEDVECLKENRRFILIIMCAVEIVMIIQLDSAPA